MPDAYDELLDSIEPPAAPEWEDFAPDSGTLGIPRSSMPQIKSEHRGAMVQYLRGRGITHENVEVAPNSLKPSQKEYSPAKVEKARGFTGKPRPILISADDHVADGHHQWLSAHADAPDAPIPAIRLNAPINQVLLEAARFPSSGVDKSTVPTSPPEPQDKAHAPDEYDKLLDSIAPAAPSRPRSKPVASGAAPPAPPSSSWQDLSAFAESHGFTVMSTTGGEHNNGSPHYDGRAVDIRTKDKTPEEVEQLMRRAAAAGFVVRDERTRPAGQAVWDGEHVHLELPDGAPAPDDYDTLLADLVDAPAPDEYDQLLDSVTAREGLENAPPPSPSSPLLEQTQAKLTPTSTGEALAGTSQNRGGAVDVTPDPKATPATAYREALIKLASGRGLPLPDAQSFADETLADAARKGVPLIRDRATGKGWTEAELQDYFRAGGRQIVIDDDLTIADLNRRLIAKYGAKVEGVSMSAADDRDVRFMEQVEENKNPLFEIPINANESLKFDLRSSQVISQAGEELGALSERILANVASLGGAVENPVSGYLRDESSLHSQAADAAQSQIAPLSLGEKIVKGAIQSPLPVAKISLLSKAVGVPAAMALLKYAERADETGGAKVFDAYASALMGQSLSLTQDPLVQAALGFAEVKARGGSTEDAIAAAAQQAGLAAGGGEHEAPTRKPLSITREVEGRTLPRDATLGERTDAIVDEALTAQLEAMRAGRRPVVVVKNGEKATVPKNMRSFGTPEGGRIIYNPELVDRADAVRRMDDGTLGELTRDVEPQIETQESPGAQGEAATTGDAELLTNDFDTIVDGEPTRVVDEAGSLHVIKRASGTGAGNQRAIPLKAAETEAAAKAGEAAKPATYGAQNALVTADRAAAARARLRQKLSPNRLNAGLDPSVLADMAEIAAFHVEAGARDFAAFSARMLEDVGDEVQPYLRDLFDHSFTRLDLTPPSGNATTAAAESVATQARTPLPEIISSVRKAGLLTGLKTHARNVLGTGAFQVAEEAAHVPAAVADIIVSMATGRRTAGGADLGSFLYATRQAATKGVSEARQIMKHGIDTEGMRQLQVAQELNSGSRILDAYTNTTFRLLNAEDKIFRTFAVSRSLEEQAAVIARNEARAGKIARSEIKARALDLRTNPTPQMETQAISDAEFATFNNDNFVTSNITSPVRQKLRESTKGRWANAAIDLVLPFDRTPTNVIARILEYSGGLPVSVGKLGYQAAAKKITGRVFTEADQKAFAQTFGRGSVGATLLTLGYVLHANGLMTGMYDDEQDERGRNNVQRAAGQPPMSVRIGDTWHQVGAFSPLGNLLAIGATLHRERTQPLKHEEDRAGRMLDIGKDVIMQQPLLQAAREVTDDGRASERLGRVAGSFVPTIVADVADALDDKQREARGFGAQVQKRVPFARAGLPEAEDVFGRPLEHRRTAAVDPTGTTTARDGQVERELQRLQVGIGKLKRTDAETAEERRARLHTDGAELYQMLNELIASRDYQAMTDADRRAALSKEVRTTRARQTRERKE